LYDHVVMGMRETRSSTDSGSTGSRSYFKLRSLTQPPQPTGQVGAVEVGVKHAV
jgi:hypothetical protein